jgi:hypothetical protein
MFGTGTGFNSKEKQLLKQKQIALESMGMNSSEAREAAKQTVKDAIAASKASGVYQSGPLGSYMTKQYKDEGMWEGLQREGVREANIREWWDLDDVERRIMKQDDDSMRMGTFLALMDEGKTNAAAARGVWKGHAIFGYFKDPPTFEDDPSSYPLPDELKLRVIRWFDTVRDVETLKQDARDFTTMNGYIRHLMENGEL